MRFVILIILKYAAHEKIQPYSGVIRSMDANIDQKIEELQGLCRKSLNGMLAMRSILLIMEMLNLSDEIINKVLGFCDRTKQEWTNRYIEQGIDGLNDLPRSGRPNFLSEDQKLDIKNAVNESSKKESIEKIITAEQIEEKIKSDFNIEYSKSGIYNLLNRLGLSKILPRPIHEKNDPEKMAKWLEELPEKIREIKENNKDKIFEFFFQDESRYGQKTIYTGIWAIKGSNVEFENQNGFLNSWIYGLVNPNSGEHFGLILPSLNGENMQIFLDEFSKTIPKNKHIIMILDGSGAHSKGVLNVPENISFIYLPPYSPKLNPIERLWKWIKSHYLCFKKYKNIDEIITEGVAAWLKTTNEIVKSVCNCDYLPKF